MDDLTRGVSWSTGVLDSVVATMPLAIVDVETTGVDHNVDRTIEIAIVRIDTGADPRLVLHTLLDPGVPVRATEIHGLTDADCRGAPSFDDVRGEVWESLAGCVVAAYNAEFEIRFLGSEFARAGVSFAPPYFCLMYLRPLLHIGDWCSLVDACTAHHVPLSSPHSAAADAQACVGLWDLYRRTILQHGNLRFRDLARRCRYSFVTSFARPPLTSHGPLTASNSGYRKLADPIERGRRLQDAFEAARMRQARGALTSACAELDSVEALIDRYQEPTALLPLDVDTFRQASRQLFAARIGLTMAAALDPKNDHQRLIELNWRLRQIPHG